MTNFEYYKDEIEKAINDKSLGTGEYIVRYINKKEDVAILIGVESKGLLVRQNKSRESTQLYTDEVNALMLQLNEIDEMLKEVGI